MKVIVIGDIHANKDWEEVYRTESFDKLIFLGDYFDTFGDESAYQQMANLQRILDLTKDDDRVIRLFGNHDLHYIIDSSYSGYQYAHSFLIKNLLINNINLFRACAIVDDVIYSHAGITTTWCEEVCVSLNNLERDINDLFKYKPNSFDFSYRGFRTNPNGDNAYQSPMWVRPYSLSYDKVSNKWMVVGHTRKKSIEIDRENKIIFADAFPKQYLRIVDGKDFNIIDFKKR